MKRVNSNKVQNIMKQNNMKKIISILVIQSFNLTICQGEIEYTQISPKEESVSVYQHRLETQYLTGESYDEYVEVCNKDINDKVSVGRKKWESTEKIFLEDKGLRYGSPLKIGMEWDNECDFSRDDHMYCKYVARVEDVTVPAGTFKNCFKIVHLTCPDEEIEWYYPGIGIIKYEYTHHGTITHEIKELEEIRLQ